MGIFSVVGDALFGGSPDYSNPFKGAEALGSEFQKFLLERLRADPAQSQSFKLGREAIRESLGGMAAGARQRLGDRAVTGGFFDSGAVGSGLADIDRAELQSFGSALRDLILGLEDRRTQDILPFLGGSASTSANIAGLQLQKRSQDFGLFSQLFSESGSTFRALL